MSMSATPSRGIGTTACSTLGPERVLNDPDPAVRIQTGEHRVETPTRALVSESANFKDAADALNSLGDFRLRLRARALEPAQALFIGVGPTAEVDRYVNTFSYDRVTSLDLEPFHLQKRRAGGNANPAPPETQTFWVQRVAGAGTQTLDWKIRDGSYEIVLMNADASPAVDANVVFGVRVPFAHSLAVIFFVAAGIILAVGITLLIIGIRVRPAPKPTPPAWPQSSPESPTAAPSPPR
jgi:hypothetical protein